MKLTVFILAAIPLAAAPRSVLPLDLGWRFLKADAPGAEKPEFADAAWRAVECRTIGHRRAVRRKESGGRGGRISARAAWAGIESTFVLPADAVSRRVFVEFDGVMANSEVWINGVSFGQAAVWVCELSVRTDGAFEFGWKENVLAVRADNAAQPASRWYPGRGNQSACAAAGDGCSAPGALVHVCDDTESRARDGHGAGGGHGGESSGCAADGGAGDSVSLRRQAARRLRAQPQTIAPREGRSSFQAEIAVQIARLWGHRPRRRCIVRRSGSATARRCWTMRRFLSASAKLTSTRIRASG